jgi:hypothetical protein
VEHNVLQDDGDDYDYDDYDYEEPTSEVQL